MALIATLFISGVRRGVVDHKKGGDHVKEIDGINTWDFPSHVEANGRGVFLRADENKPEARGVTTDWKHETVMLRFSKES